MAIDTMLQKISDKYHINLEYDNEQELWKASHKNKPAQSVIPHDPGNAVYIGKLKNDKPTGYGKLYISAPPGGYTEYHGYWKNGRFHGAGKFKIEYSSHSYTYTGTFKNGKKHGFGSEQRLFESYTGLFKNDEQCGKSYK